MYNPNLTEKERKRQERLEKDRQRIGKRAREWIAKGVCKACGSKRESENCQLCDRCEDIQRKSALKYRLGVTGTQYDEMLVRQNGVCWICKREEKGKRGRLHVDHDHNTGKIRGLLCSNCNRAIGFLCHSVELLQQAIEYLKAFN